MAALFCSAATTAYGQQAPESEQPDPDLTTVEEPIAGPDAPPITPLDDPGEEPLSADNEAAPPDASGIDLSTLETENLSLLYFDPAQTFLTPYLGRAVENALEFHMKLFDWTPWDRTTVLLKDFGDYGNAAARSSPNNAMLFDVAPLSQSMETFTPGERFFTLTNHELAHVATMDVWNSTDARWRKLLFGKPMPIQEHPESILWNFLATPRNAVPRWYLEGSAVFFETWMAGGLGRAQGAYDEMVFRAKVRDGDKFYSPLGLESAGTAVDFQVGVNDYLYGTRFFSYLALTYGPQKPVDWLKRGEGSKAFYAAQFKHVFGKRLDDAWDEWIAFEQAFQKENLAKLSAYPLTEVQHLSPKGLGSISRGFVDSKTNRLIAAFRYPGEIGFMGTMDLATGELRKLQEIKGMMLYKVTSLAFDEDTRKAYYTEDNYAFRDIVEVDVDTGKKRMLLRDARIGDIVLNKADKSIWGIRHQNGYATIVRIPLPYAGFNQIFTFDYGQTPFDLDVSPDGSLVSASFGEIDGNQSVRIWTTESLEAGAPDVVARLDLPPSTPEGFTFTPDGTALLGTSYYTGVSNVFRFDIASQQWEVLTNASTGFFRPMQQADGSLLVYEYAGDGLTPSRIQPQKREDLGTVQFLGQKVIATHGELKDWGVGSPARIDLDARITERGKYNAFNRMKLGTAYPIVQGYQGLISPGYYIHFEDPLQFSQFDITFSVSPWGSVATKGERFHLDLKYQTLNWTLQYKHNGADFYDLFGPVERSRKGDAFLVKFNKTKVYDPPRTLDIFFNAGAYLGLEQLPSAQNVSSPKNIFSLEGGLKYSNTRKALGGVDHEKGIQWRAATSVDFAQGDVFPKLYGGIDYGVPLPMPNSSVWGYLSAGVSGGPAASPLGSFYFGSFGNNYVDNREEKRYREMESFAGFEINQIAARRFVKLTGEVNLPPLRFEEVGTPAFYLKYARPAFFVGGMLTDDPAGKSHSYANIGAQIDLAFTVALRLPMVFSIGAAAGFEDGHYEKIEYLASLKIM